MITRRTSDADRSVVRLILLYVLAALGAFVVCALGLALAQLERACHSGDVPSPQISEEHS